MLKITYTNLSEKLKIKSINNENIQDQKFQKQSKQAFDYDQHVKCQRKLKEGQDVYVYQNEKWREVVVEKKCTEPRSYIVMAQDIYRRNKNRLRPVQSEETSVEMSHNKKDNVDDENQVNNEKLEIKSENQSSPKIAVRRTR